MKTTIFTKYTANKNIKLTRFTPQFWYEVKCTWLVGHGATYVRRYTWVCYPAVIEIIKYKDEMCF
jgi:hypothetical protein